MFTESSLFDGLKYGVFSGATFPMMEERKTLVLDVNPRLRKPDIKCFMEQAFGVRVQKINTHLRSMNRSGRGPFGGRWNKYKRVLVRLSADEWTRPLFCETSPPS